MIRSVVIAALTLVALFAGLRFANALATVQIRTVVVEGELSAAENEAVQAAVDQELGRPGLRSAADVVAAVQALGWPRQTRVRRLWPDVLHVQVVAETPAAHWGDNAYLTADGSVVRSESSVAPGAGVPVFDIAVADAGRAMQVFEQLNESARAAGLGIERVRQDSAGVWRVTFGSGAELVLGRAELRERFARFVAIYERALHSRAGDIAAVDARYPSGVAVRWKSPRSNPAPADAGRLPRRQG